MTSARERVFALPKVLERILLHLPLDDLLAVQLVCRHWQAIHRGSDLIQQALFRAPMPLPQLHVQPEHQLAESSRYMTQDSMHWEGYGAYACTCGRAHPPKYAGSTTLNPFMTPAKATLDRWEHGSKPSQAVHIYQPLVDRIERHTGMREMFFIQPQRLTGFARVSSADHWNRSTLVEADLSGGVTGAQMIALGMRACAEYAVEHPHQGREPRGSQIANHAGSGAGGGGVEGGAAE
ncbi:hypothetical protein LTR85_009646 [Meristemomyces frigidus]|nr:hypothetical protein LTR85_009646 [Meristemomyces frigidus]